MIRKVILIYMLLVMCGCDDNHTTGNMVKAIQANTKECLLKAETEEDRFLCLEESDLYRRICFDKDGYFNFRMEQCTRLIDKHIANKEK